VETQKTVVACYSLIHFLLLLIVHIFQLKELNHSHVHIKDKDEVNKKLNVLFKGRAGSLQVSY